MIIIMDNNVHVPFLQDREDALLQGTDNSYVRRTIQNNNNTLTRQQDHEDALQNASECFRMQRNNINSDVLTKRSSLILTIIQEQDIGCSQSQCFFRGHPESCA